MPGLSRVAIIGGGFSGALQAVNLLRHDGPGAVLIERRPEVGRGTAYSTRHPEHLLNVRASNMSASSSRGSVLREESLSGPVQLMIAGEPVGCCPLQ